MADTMRDNVRVDLPGLLKERLPSGNYRYRVRVAGDKARRIRLYVEPDHKDFIDHYRAARSGVAMTPAVPKSTTAKRGSMAWLTYRYTEHLENQQAAGNISNLTLKKKKMYLKQLRDRTANYPIHMPTTEVEIIKSEMAATPDAANSMIETITAMYRFARKEGICDFNPTRGVDKYSRKKGGAVPWTVADLKQYRECHPPGTKAHLALTIFMFTACRISDAVLLGRGHEQDVDGLPSLVWQPAKKGSAEVCIPIAPPLYKATRAQKVIGKTYLVTEHGRPYGSPDSLGQVFRRWCREAGLENRSSHGIRKAAGDLLAMAGCTQYQIMSIHGHTEAKTSEVYTRGAERRRLAAAGMSKLGLMEW